MQHLIIPTTCNTTTQLSEPIHYIIKKLIFLIISIPPNGTRIHYHHACCHVKTPSRCIPHKHRVSKRNLILFEASPRFHKKKSKTNSILIIISYHIYVMQHLKVPTTNTTQLSVHSRLHLRETWSF